VNPADMEPYVAPYVQVRHAIHLLYATSPRSRDGETLSEQDGINHRFDKHGNRLPLELHGCGCSLCARSERRRLNYWEAR
jgi:nitroimidazol reductase NimA-like FMN-containing flavoprotein (pyridoxamine 5'-phosphate oxidase superfamily)